MSALNIGSVDSAFVPDVTNPTTSIPCCLIATNRITLKMETLWGQSSHKQIGLTAASDPPKTTQ